ncbi:hypothetical protein BHE74_00059763 [Ensete ventricosum]|nr:hypothetical protein BHE74_00059763 [Ensete ventricosum]RZS09727.1 hypothetical protein BHM03_00040854 [Ensete ventricosum]
MATTAVTETTDSSSYESSNGVCVHSLDSGRNCTWATMEASYRLLLGRQTSSLTTEEGSIHCVYGEGNNRKH